MSRYALQRAIWDINRNPQIRGQFMSAAAEVVEGYDLLAEERDALVNRDYGALYRMGVHGLLLRPFSILHAVSEPDYLNAIRAES